MISVKVYMLLKSYTCVGVTKVGTRIICIQKISFISKVDHMQSGRISRIFSSCSSLINSEVHFFILQATNNPITKCFSGSVRTAAPRGPRSN